MNIEKKQNGSSCILKIAGRLDTASSPELDTEIKSLPADIAELTLDCTDLEYISSAGLRVLLAAHTDMSERGRFAVTNVNSLITEIFNVTGFADILNIE